MRSQGVALLLALLLAGCEAVDKGLEITGVKHKVESETGVDVDPAIEAAKALHHSFEEITPEQEYYIGRAVAAEVLARTPVLEDDIGTAYVNRVGQTLAQASDRPDVFGGYHVILLDSDDVNALAAPGAFLFVTRGLLRCCRTEDELAAVLAHEVAHIARRDGMRMIQQSERFQALVDLGVEEALEAGNVGVLKNALDRIASEFATTLLQHGYSRSLEKQADLDALALLDRVGYRATALKDLLGRLDAETGGGEGTSLLATHAALSQRAKVVVGELSRYPSRGDSPARQARFDAALKSARG